MYSDKIVTRAVCERGWFNEGVNIANRKYPKNKIKGRERQDRNYIVISLMANFRYFLYISLLIVISLVLHEKYPAA